MKKNTMISLLASCFLVLNACAIREDAAELYPQETPLEVEILTPKSFSKDKTATVRAVLTQEGKKLEGASFVHFQIWKQDGSVTYPMEEAKKEGNGVYSMAVQFKSEGLYYIEVHAGNNGSLISPRKQFVVGALSDSEMDFLKQGQQNPKEIHGPHH